MARLGNWLCLSERKGCIGVRRGREVAEMVCSFVSGAIEVYNVHDQGHVHSWNLPNSDHITCPAVHHSPSDHYCLVRNDKELVCWTVSSEKFDGSPRTLPPGVVHSLLSPSGHPYVLVVYKEGKVVTMHVERGQSPENERETTFVKTKQDAPEMHLSALTSVDDQECLVLVHTHTGCTSVTRCPLMDQGLGDPVTAVLEQTGVVTSACICGSQLLLLTVDGSLTIFNLRVLKSSSPLPFLSPWKHTSLTPPPSTPHIITSVSDNYFALVSSHEDGTGQVSLWDSTYTTCQSTADVGLKLTQLDNVGGYLAAVSDDGVNVCRVEGEEEGGLVAALGRGRGGATSHVIIQSWLPPEADREQWKVELTRNQESVATYITALSSPDNTSSKDEFMKVFESRPLSQDVPYDAVVKRLLGEKELWGRDVLIQLLQEHLFPMSCADQLLEAAINKEDWALVSILLSCVDHVSEECLVTSIESLLSLPEESYSSEVTRDNLLLQLLSLPKNDALLQSPLSRMPFPLVQAFLTFIHRHITTYSLMSTQTTPTSYPAIIEWAGLVIDTHFIQLFLSPESRKLVKQLHDSVDQQIELVNHLLPLRPLLDALSTGKPITLRQQVQAPNWRYSVDRLKLNI